MGIKLKYQQRQLRIDDLEVGKAYRNGVSVYIVAKDVDNEERPKLLVDLRTGKLFNSNKQIRDGWEEVDLEILVMSYTSVLGEEYG